MHGNKVKKRYIYFLGMAVLIGMALSADRMFGSGKYSNSFEVVNQSQAPISKVKVTIGGAALDAFDVPPAQSVKVYSMANPDGAILVTGVWKKRSFSCEIGYTARGFQTDSWLNIEEDGAMKMFFKGRNDSFVSERDCELS